MGGALLENRMCEDCGDYDSEYTMNAGTYYEKLYTAYMLTESEDNFISDSRGDFLDGRYRAVSMADMFPDGFRRWLANNLTNDDFIRAPRVRMNSQGAADTDSDGFIKSIGWTRWTPKSGPKVCFPVDNTLGTPASGRDLDDPERFQADPAFQPIHQHLSQPLPGHRCFDTTVQVIDRGRQGVPSPSP